MKFVADVADGETGLEANLFVFEALFVFETDEGLVGFREFGEEEPEGTECFKMAEVDVRGRIKVESIRRWGIGVMGRIADVVESEVADGAVEPRFWGIDLIPVGVEFEESVLNEIFGGLSLFDEAESEVEKIGFLG